MNPRHASCRNLLCGYFFFQLILAIFFAQDACASQVQLAWNNSADATVIGYKVYHGTQSRTYSIIEDAKANLSFTISGLSETQPQYFAVTAYSAAAESDFSAELTCYTIQASSSGSGQILPAGSTVFSQDSSTTYTIVPNAGYKIADVVIDGVSVGPSSQYTFANLSNCHTISAVFTPSNAYTIATSIQGSGSISPSGTVSVTAGANQTFAISPAANYKISDVKVDGVSVGAVSSYSFTKVAANHTIAATFAPISYTISASIQGSGSISPSGTVSVTAGANQTFAISPAANYKISDVKVDGVSVGAVSSYTFTNIRANHSMIAVFAAKSQPPVANSGPNQVVASGATVTLNGSISTDTAGITSYRWVQTSGPAVALSNTSASKCSFKAPTVSTGAALTFRLDVTNRRNISASDSCIVDVSATDQVPLANAGSNQTVTPYTIVTLNGSGSVDKDDGIASYAWTQTAGPTVEISNANTDHASFVAPDAGQGGCTLAFQLMTTDHIGLKTTDRCLVNVVEANEPPIASAGPDQTVYEKAKVILSGSGSYDPEASTLSYRWTQISGLPVTLSNPKASKPSFTAPNLPSGTSDLVFMLMVTDAGGISASDKCIITIKDTTMP
ncbi:MAG: hypothetical protein ABFD97_06185 [Syntrophobacter sp.]